MSSQMNTCGNFCGCWLCQRELSVASHILVQCEDVSFVFFVLVSMNRMQSVMTDFVASMVKVANVALAS